jgi:glycosyltransferase involved in cell wall biosynthesis
MRPVSAPVRQAPELVVAHDYLVQMGGAERVVASMLRRHGNVPVYTSVVRPEGLLREFRGAQLNVSWMQGIPRIAERFKHYYALYPHAFRSFGVVPCRSAWVSASTFAKCMRFAPGTATVLYCHSPTRFLWDTDVYLDGEQLGPLRRRLVRSTLPPLRRFDRQAASRFDVIVANSEAVRRRIREHYGRDALVIHPPVELKRFEVSRGPSEDYHLVLSRLVGYKALDRAVQAFTAMGKALVVIGEGPDRARLERMAGPTVRFLGQLPDADVARYLAGCRSVIFPGEEDFGIVPVEAQACGKPVVAFGRGGALETVVAGETGCFFHEPEADSLAQAVKEVEAASWDVDRIRRNAERFSEDVFHARTDRLLAELAEAKARASADRRMAEADLTGLDPGQVPPAGTV